MPLKIDIDEHKVISSTGMREPMLFKLANNDLLLSFHSVPDVHFAKRDCMRSTDNGETWFDDTPRSYREQAIGKGIGNTVIGFDIYTFEKKTGLYSGSYYLSSDGGKTFEGPLESTIRINRVAPHPYPLIPEELPEDGHPLRKFYIPLPEYYKPLVDKTSNRLGFNFWRYTVEHDGVLLAAMQGKFHADRAYRTILVSSSDNGKTWNFLTTIAYEDNRTIDGMCEPVLCKVADNSLLCIMRRDGGKQLAQCRSLDGGKTWTEPELLAAHGVDPDLCLMSNGVLACTYGRPGLHIMFSEDGCGYSWGYAKEIGKWRSSCYMGISEISRNKLLLVYDKVLDDAPDAGRTQGKCCIAQCIVNVEKNKL